MQTGTGEGKPCMEQEPEGDKLDRGDEGAELKDADSTLSGLACSLPSISRHPPIVVAIIVPSVPLRNATNIQRILLFRSRARA